jgi:hypothetical protein
LIEKELAGEFDLCDIKMPQGFSGAEKLLIASTKEGEERAQKQN